MVKIGQLVASPGSNAWAIAPSRAESKHAMLLINPHLMWSGQQIFYEAHLIGPGTDFYGATPDRAARFGALVKELENGQEPVPETPSMAVA